MLCAVERNLDCVVMEAHVFGTVFAGQEVGHNGLAVDVNDDVGDGVHDSFRSVLVVDE